MPFPSAVSKQSLLRPGPPQPAVARTSRPSSGAYSYFSLDFLILLAAVLITTNATSLLLYNDGGDQESKLGSALVVAKAAGGVSNAMRQVLDFGDAARGRPLLVHCWAGISRSSAAAYAIACGCNPGFEREIAMELRRRAPEATPNRLMVVLADDLLVRNGVMVDAIASIGRGAEAFEGAPYQLPLAWPISG